MTLSLVVGTYGTEQGQMTPQDIINFVKIVFSEVIVMTLEEIILDNGDLQGCSMVSARTCTSPFGPLHHRWAPG